MTTGESGEGLTPQQTTLLRGYLHKYDGETLVRAGASRAEYEQLIAETRAKVEALGISELSEREYFALIVGAAVSTQAVKELISLGSSPDQASDVVNLGIAGLHTTIEGGTA